MSTVLKISIKSMSFWKKFNCVPVWIWYETKIIKTLLDDQLRGVRGDKRFWVRHVVSVGNWEVSNITQTFDTLVSALDRQCVTWKRLKVIRGSNNWKGKNLFRSVHTLLVLKWSGHTYDSLCNIDGLWDLVFLARLEHVDTLSIRVRRINEASVTKTLDRSLPPLKLYNI